MLALGSEPTGQFYFFCFHLPAPVKEDEASSGRSNTTGIGSTAPAELTAVDVSELAGGHQPQAVRDTGLNLSTDQHDGYYFSILSVLSLRSLGR